jgi:WD40 repeat protein
MSNDFERNFAVMIGINDYKDDIGILKTAVPDARKFARIIENQHNNLKKKYQSKNKYQVKLYVDKEANKCELEKLITDFTNGQIPFVNEKNEKVTVTKEDRVLFYFAGHGKAFDALEDKDGPVGYLFPQDAAVDNEGKFDENTCVKMQDLHDALIKLPCRHLLVILDCCFAGAFRWASLQREAKAKVTVYKERYDRFISDAAWQVITSASDDQTALDSSGKRDGNEEHSPFAQALFDALGGKNADLNKDGIITATELYSYLRDRVEDSPDYKRQTPELCQLKKHNKGEFIFLSPEFDRDNLADAPPLNPENNPYKGLDSYDKKDSDLFFGRTEQIEKLYQKVVNNKQGLTLVLGASGMGKSSLVKAGLIPKLGDNTWRILPPFRPGEFPFTSLNTALKSRNQPSIATSEQATSADLLTHAAASLANWFNNNPQAKLMVVIDQFEELITLCKREEGEQFQELIKHALDKYRDKIHVVITLRLNFEAKFKTSILKDFWHDDAQFVVSPMTQDELREVIEKPALEKVLYFDPPSLVDTLINKVVQMPGALPLLSFVLSELYEKYSKDRTRNNRALTEIDYQSLGGVGGAIANSADRKYAELVTKNSAYKNTVRQVMSRMVSLQGGALARRQVPRSELVYANEEENNRVETAINCFSEARLIVEGSNAQGEPYVEPAHDMLVQNWTQLMDWVNEDEGKIILQRRLAQSAEEWSKKIPTNKSQLLGLQTNDGENIIDRLDRVLYGPEDLFRKVNDWRILHSKSRQNHQKESPDNPKFFLWDSNPYLDDVSNRQRQSDRHWLNELENKFVEKSVLQKRRNTSWWWRIAGAVTLTISIAAIIAFIQWINTQKQLVSTIGALTNNSQELFESNKEFDALLASLNAGTQKKRLAFGTDNDLDLRIKDAVQNAVHWAKEQNRLEGHQASVNSVSFSPNRQVLASGSEDRTIGIWDVATGMGKTYPFRPETSWGSIDSVSFSPNGKTLAFAGEDKIIKLWDVDPNTVIKLPAGHSGRIRSVSFSHNGRILASAGWDNTIKLWDVTTRKEIDTLSGHRQFINSVSFSSDDQFLASASEDLSIKIWNIHISPEVKPLIAHGDEVWSIGFSPNGKLLASGSKDTTINIWDVATGKIKNSLNSLPKDGFIRSVSFNPKDENVVAFANYYKIALWDFVHNEKIYIPTKHSNITTSISFSPDGESIAESNWDKNIYLWDVAKREQIKTLEGHKDKVNNVSFSPDGLMLASGSEDKNIILWDVATGEHKTLTGHTAGVHSVSFSPSSSPNGSLLVSSGINKAVFQLHNGFPL